MSTKYKLGFLPLAIVVFALTTLTSASSEYTVDVKYDTDLGSYLVNGTGMTLYYHEGDTSGTSKFTPDGDWTPFCVEEIKAVRERVLKLKDFNTTDIEIDGSDKKQVTYKGWPLYLYNGDEDPGDINGHGENSGEGINKMYVVDPTDFPPE